MVSSAKEIIRQLFQSISSQKRKTCLTRQREHNHKGEHYENKYRVTSKIAPAPGMLPGRPGEYSV
jgi:hypothetical protein